MKGYGNRATINVGGVVSTTEIKGKELVREDEITQYLEETGGGAFTSEELQNAVSNYLDNNPIESGGLNATVNNENLILF